MFGISMWELVLVGIILFLVVGPAKLPGLAKSIGQGIRDLRKNLSDIKGTVDRDDEFVKAVKEARQSVAEAREAVRSIFDDSEGETPGAAEQSEDPAPKPVPKGRPLVRRGRSGQGEGSRPGISSDGPRLGEDPVEAEVWRGNRGGAESEDPRLRFSAEGGPSEGVALPDRDPAPRPYADPKAEDPGAPDPVAEDPGDRGSPASPSRQRAGRRMVRPGRRRSEGGGSAPGSQ